MALGHEYLVMSDHSARLTVAHGLSRERLLDQLVEISALNFTFSGEGSAFRVLTGMEVDINCRPERLDPPMALLKRAAELGCRFAVDTDAHAPGQLEWQGFGCNRAADARIAPDRIVNSLTRSDLLAWAASH